MKLLTKWQIFLGLVRCKKLNLEEVQRVRNINKYLFFFREMFAHKDAGIWNVYKGIKQDAIVLLCFILLSNN